MTRRACGAGLRGQDGLYLSLSVAPGERNDDFHTEEQGLENILAAAREAGIAAHRLPVGHDPRHARSGWWVLDVWRQALARIKASGIPYTIFYPTNFMETLPQRHMRGRVFVMIGRPLYPNYWIAGRDFGRQVARSFAIAAAANREYYIQGPEPMTYDEAAERYARALQPSPFMVRVPMWAARLGGLFSRLTRLQCAHDEHRAELSRGVQGRAKPGTISASRRRRSRSLPGSKRPELRRSTLRSFAAREDSAVEVQVVPVRRVELGPDGDAEIAARAHRAPRAGSRPPGPSPL